MCSIQYMKNNIGNKITDHVPIKKKKKRKKVRGINVKYMLNIFPLLLGLPQYQYASGTYYILIIM